MAANTTGYGNASVSLLTAQPSTILDANNTDGTYGDYYVLTGSDGSFTITGDYSCTPGTQVYLYVYGGRPAGPNILANSGAGFLAALGNCPASKNFLTTVPYIAVNEVSTIATAYAIAGFATDALHVSSSGTALAQTGIANAFANVANLISIPRGTALATTPAANGAVPQSTINTLANILASCVNSNDVTSNTNGSVLSSQCTALFSLATSDGTFTGAQPSDTANAALNIAHNPSMNISGLFGLSSASAPFEPSLSTQPNDFTVALNFTGAGLLPGQIAIDGSGNIWIANYNKVTEFSSLGVAVTGSPFTGGGLSNPQGIAVDGSGSVWITNVGSPSDVVKLSSSGAASSGSPFTAGGLSSPINIAIDGSGNAWITNSSDIVKLSNSGSILSGANGYPVSGPSGIAIDGSGSAWVTNSGNNSVTKLSSIGSILSGSNGYTGGGLDDDDLIAMDSSGNAWISNYQTVSNGFNSASVTELSNAGSAKSSSSGYTGGGLHQPEGIAIDGSGNIWLTNLESAASVNGGNGSITELSSSGSILSGANGYTGGKLYEPDGIAIDGSGNVWVTNYNTNSLTEIIGSATPVITPICAGLPSIATSDGSSNLGTRP